MIRAGALSQVEALEAALPTAPLSAYPYTSQQRRVIEKLLAGKSNKAIAQELEISITTVKDHLGNIYKIGGVKSRLEFAAKFLGRG